MEPAAAWGPSYEFQLADWAPVTEVWAPAPYYVLPVEYASIDIFGSCCSHPAYVPQSVVGQEQRVGYYTPSPSPSPSPSPTLEPSDPATRRRPTVPGNITGNQLEADEDDIGKYYFSSDDIDQMKNKMHRYPASLRHLDKSYTMPRIVAIGPLQEDRSLAHLKQAEDMKHEAVAHCVRQSSCGSTEELFRAFVSATAGVFLGGHVYEVNTNVSDKFRYKIFYDACFLVQYMRMVIKRAHGKPDNNSSLHASFLSPNFMDILHDVTLLENQLPWKVVEAVLELVPDVSSKDFVDSLGGWMQDHKLPQNERRPFIWYEDYKPPHLLGLLRYYTVRRSGDEDRKLPEPMKRSVSASAMELARIGISLTPDKTTELIEMGVKKKWVACGLVISLSPLSLDRNRASILVNMAALELCTVPSFGAALAEESAVCSYLLLLATLAYRVEDVHDLRQMRLLQGGAGLTNEEALLFFNSIKGVRLGKRYIHIMKHIERYKENKLTGMLAGFVRYYNDNKTTIKTVAAGVASVGSIIGTLVSIKDKL